jgi:membrane peptidoglycan carboxypeptidase
LIRPALNSKNFPVAAKTGTNDTNGSTWVVGYTSGLATASWFGDPLADQSRYGRNLTINGKFYPSIDGYMIAGPQFTNYMLAVAPAYGTNPFQQPPSNLLGTAPAPQRNNSPSNTPSTAPNPAPPSGNGNNGNGNNGNGNGNKN